ncbi:MAG: AmmeMemoRadiSam system radical SAM enzyme [Candidatus Altiarchaeota archaeon]
MKEALLYEKVGDDTVRCNLCSHRCKIQKGKRGICSVRENIDGKLYSLVYGKVIASHIDPIEKKPLYHFLPGTMSYSIATVGCNFSCKNCQNFDISQASKGKGAKILGQDLMPEEIVNLAKKYKCESISYTYTEPTIFFEYALDVSKLAKKENLYNNFVTNGYMTEEMLRYSEGFIDAANVDLKSFSEKFYQKICGAHLEPVLSSLKLMKKMGVWVEITTLLIPTLNDSEEELKEISNFIKDELGEETPWHISRFHPDYKLLDFPPTPIEKIHRAREIGLDSGLRYVYSGNIPGDVGENTYCYNCKELLIKRFIFDVLENKIEKGKCPNCGAKIDGVFI